MEKLNVAIADDNERMVDLLSTLVKGDKELELVGQAADGQEIYKIIKRERAGCGIAGHYHAQDGWDYSYGKAE
ncbi:MAG: hypothetical protein ACLVAT_08420 [Lachnospiraceae bacterium]